MPATISSTYSGSIDNTTGTATCAITRAAGEGLLFSYYYEYDFSAPSTISSVVWDPTGDNQTMTLVLLQQSDVNNRYLALYQLKNPTSAKSGNVVVTHGGTTLSRGGYVCQNVSSFNTTSWITNSNSRSETNAVTNNLPITVNSASGELGVFFGFVRNDAVFTAAGDSSNYVELNPIQGVTTRSIISGSKASTGGTVGVTFAYSDTTSYDTALIGVSIAPSSGGGAPLFLNSLGGQLSGLGSGGKFFQNPLQRTADAWQRIRGIFVPRSYNLNGI